MATIAKILVEVERSDRLSGTPRAGFVDRWIYLFMAASFVAITITGFLPDTTKESAAIRAGERPPFSPMLHVHAVLMGAFLLLLLAQTVLVAVGRRDLHRRLGRAGVVLAPAVVIVGFLLVPINYHALCIAAEGAPPAVRQKLLASVSMWENLIMLQAQIGILFSLFLFMGLRARSSDPGLHKRMMILATALPLPAAINRIPWLPSSLPESPLSAELDILAVLAPMFLWDVVRNKGVHRAYWIWLGLVVPTTLAINAAWDTRWWHAAAKRLMGV